MPKNRYAIEIRRYTDPGNGRSVAVNTVTQIAELAVAEAGNTEPDDRAWLEVYDHANSSIMEVYYDPPPVNQFLLRHVNHPEMAETDKLVDYVICMKDMERFTQERFGEWEGRFWKSHHDPGQIEKACDELWEYVDANHRQTLRDWKALIDRRDRASEKLMVKMGIRLCRRVEGVEDYMIETADEDPNEEEYTLARVLAADTPAKFARAMLKYIPTIRDRDIG